MNDICYELHFNNRVVKTFKKRDTNFWKAFQKNKSKYPQNIAVTDGNKKFTYDRKINNKRFYKRFNTLEEAKFYASYIHNKEIVNI